MSQQRTDRLRRRLDDVLRQALDRPDGEREVFLEWECADDPDLLKQARHLLRLALDDDPLFKPGGAQHGAVWKELLTSLSEDEQDAEDVRGQPSAIGDYTIEREIGRGGMGEVYLADRPDATDSSGRVAIKVMRARDLGDEATRRFEFERRILTAIDHPAIAQIYGGGTTDDGRPYFVMEYVAGLPIDVYCDRHQLSIEQRLRLFVEVARAVHHAHRCMVVHRDLKPSNILATEDCQVKLLDFGIAKLLQPSVAGDSEPMTRAGMRVMTPEFACPEQVRGELVTVSSDVYQLGVLLYILLTGRHPHQTQGHTLAEIEQMICDQTPKLPSAAVAKSATGSQPSDSKKVSAKTLADARGMRIDRLSAHLRGDLDTIAMMALRKEPSRRYASVDRLIQDIERFLNGRPVAARKDTPSYRLTKFIRRHRFGVAAGCVIFLLLAALVGFDVNRRLEEHEQTLREAQRAEQIAGFLEGLFDVAEPDLDNNKAISAKELLDRGAGQLDGDLRSQPGLNATLSALLGDIYRKLGHYEEAERLLEQAVNTRSFLLDESHPDVAEGRIALAKLYTEVGRYDEAEDLFQRALSTQRKEFGAGSLIVGKTQIDIAELQVAAGKLEEAEGNYRTGLELHRDHLNANDPEVAKALSGLSSLYWSLGRFEEAEPLLVQSLEINEASADRDDRELANALGNLGQLYTRTGELDKAEDYLVEGHTILEELLGSRHPHVGMSLRSIARLRIEQGNFTEAESLLRQAVDVLRDAYPKGHPDLGDCLNELGLFYMDEGDLSRATPLVEEAVAIGEATLGRDHPDMAAGLNSLATLYWKQGRLEEAQSAFEQALAIAEISLGPDHPNVAMLLVNLAGVHGAIGAHGTAIELCDRAVTINIGVYGEDHPEVAYSRSMLATHQRACGHYDEARKQLVLALRVQQDPSFEMPADLAATLGMLCSLNADLGNYDQAVGQCQSAVVVLEENFGADDFAAAEIRLRLAGVRALQNRHAEAVVVLRNTLAQFEQVLGAANYGLVPVLCALGRSLVAQNHLQEARDTLERGLALADAAALEEPDVVLDRVEILVQIGRVDQLQERERESLRNWQEALRLCGPLAESTCLVRGRRLNAAVLHELGRAEEARALANDLATLGHDHPDLREILR